MTHLGKDGSEGFSSRGNEGRKEGYGLQDVLVVEGHKHVACPLHRELRRHQQVQQAAHAVPYAVDGEVRLSENAAVAAVQPEVDLIGYLEMVKACGKGCCYNLHTAVKMVC